MLAIQAIARETVPNAAAPALASEGQADTVLAHTSAPRSELTAHVCSESQRNQAAAFTPERPLKPASYVHVEAAQQTWLCLVDARGQVVEIELRPGEARSFSGTPPFLVQSPNPQALRLFFQGLRVPGALVGPNGVLLQAVPST